MQRRRLHRVLESMRMEEQILRLVLLLHVHLKADITYRRIVAVGFHMLKWLVRKGLRRKCLLVMHVERVHVLELLLDMMR